MKLKFLWMSCLAVSLISCGKDELNLTKGNPDEAFDKGADYSMPVTQKLSSGDKQAAQEFFGNYNLTYGLVSLVQAKVTKGLSNSQPLESMDDIVKDLQSHCVFKETNQRESITQDILGAKCPIEFHTSRTMVSRNLASVFASPPSSNEVNFLLKTSENFKIKDNKIFEVLNIRSIQMKGREQLKGRVETQLDYSAQSVGEIQIAQSLEDTAPLIIRAVTSLEQKIEKSSKKTTLKIGVSGPITPMIFLISLNEDKNGELTLEFYINGELQDTNIEDTQILSIKAIKSFTSLIKI